MLKTMIPVAIGLAVVIWLFCREFSIEDWNSIRWTARTAMAILMALLFTVGREWGLAWRFRALTDRRLSWRQAVRITMLCEFTSAVTPTTAGGSAMSMVFMNREGISMGRATTLMMTTLLLDELFFVVSIPVILIIVPYSDLFGITSQTFTAGLRIAFWIVYGGICAWTLVLFIGIFLKPHFIRNMLTGLFRWRLLRRWSDSVRELADNIVATSLDIKSRPWRWWAEAMWATTLSWISRYLVVNALFWGFAATASQLVVFARQFVVWTVLTVSPTPGGSGLSEWLFTNYYGDMIHDTSVALVIAIFWRVVSYYLYLFIGAAIIPGWLRKNHKKTDR